MTQRRPSSSLLALVLLLAAPAASAQLRLPPAGGGPGSVPFGPAFAVPAPAPAAPAPAASSSGPVLVDRVVAIVNTEAITERELEARVGTILARMRLQNVQPPPMDEMRRQVLDRMVVDRAALQAARDAGIRIDDAAVDRAIARIAQDAKLGVPQLRQQLESMGTPFVSFRQEVAAEMAIGRLRERDVEARVQVSEAEVDALLAEQAGSGGAAGLEYTLGQILVRLPEGAPAAEVEQARLRAEAIAREARSGADFERLAAAQGGEGNGVFGPRPADRLPSLFVQAVEPLSAGQVAPVVRSPAGFHVIKLIERRSAGAAKLAGPPVRQTRARHILVRVNEINPEAEVVRRLTEIRQRIEQGTVTFADMARQYSSDGTASQGGELGWVYPGDTVPEFERAMNALEPGRIAGPVQTPFGYHLIEVLERRTDEASPDRVRALARSTLRERKAAEAWQEWLAQVRDRAYVDLRLEER